MYNLTKLKLLWEKVTGIEKKITNNTAYTPPAYSSTEEVNTGQKWVDGRDIYRKVFTGTIPESESTQTITIAENLDVTPISYDFIILTTGNAIILNRYYGTINYAGTFTIPGIPNNYNLATYYVILNYVKTPATATRSDDLEQIDKGTGMITGEEPEQETKTVKRKTTKKEENNK